MFEAMIWSWIDVWDIQEHIKSDKDKNPSIQVVLDDWSSPEARVTELLAEKWIVLKRDINKKKRSNFSDELFDEIIFDDEGNIISHPNFEEQLWLYAELIPYLTKWDKTTLIWVLQFLYEDNKDRINLEQNKLGILDDFKFFIQNLAEFMNILETKESSPLESYKRVQDLFYEIIGKWYKVNDFIIKQMVIYSELAILSEKDQY